MSQGSISLIIGPMFSGKTTELLRQAKRYKLAGKSVLMIKYANDNRYSEDKIITHNGSCLDLTTISVLDANEIVQIDDYHVLVIDEGQFIKNIVEFCDVQANKGKIIICAGLDADFNRNAFPLITNLIPKAEIVLKLSSVCCHCGNDAFFTKRKFKSDEIEIIGGEDLYEPVCRTCFQ